MRFARLVRGIFLLFVLVLPLLAGCGKSAGGVSEYSTSNSAKSRNLAPASTSASETAVVGAINELGVDLLHKAEDLAGNAVVTPFSASFALAQLRAGAAGTTRGAIEGVMHLPNSVTDVDAVFNALDLSLRSRLDHSVIRLLSYEFVAGWTQTGYGYRVSFLDNLAENYGITTGQADFARTLDAAYGSISSWSWHTAGFSPTSLSQDTRLVLGVATQLPLSWQDPFDPAQTSTGTFQLMDSSLENVRFLQKTAVISKANGDGYVALALPLTLGQQFLIVLPDQGRFAEIEATLTAARWQQISQSLAPTMLNLALPVFTITSSINLDLGVAQTKGSADFSGIDGTKDLFVSAAIHASTLTIDAAGLRAGALTMHALDDAIPETWTAPGGSNGVIISQTNTDPVPAENLILGRSFLFAVRDTASGVLLLLGRVIDPLS